MLIVLIVLGVGGFIGLRHLEQKMIYFPTVFPEGYWDISGFPGQIEDCSFQTPEGISLHGWFVHGRGTRREERLTVIFFHGNAGNITHRLTNIAYLIQLGVNVFIFDYRGYGKSEGKPSEKGLYTDAVAAYEYVLRRDDVSKDQIVFFGRSLGGAVAVELATRKPCKKLILESTFTSVKDMSRELFRVMPVHYVVHTKFDSLSKIHKIHVPLLVIHGTEDTVVPFEQGKRLFMAANEPKQFYEIHGANHNDTYEIGGVEYFRRFSQFLSGDFES